MSANLISPATRTEFREVLQTFVLREIDDIFSAGELVPDLQYQPPVGGQRRTLVEQYLITVDLTNPVDVRRLLKVLEELLFRLTHSVQDGLQGVQQTVDKLLGRMARDGFRYENGRFLSDKLIRPSVSAPKLIALTEESIAEHVEKANNKIDDGDPSGAIASAYTLVEGFLKEIHKPVTGIPLKDTEGDIRTLYASVADCLHLSPKEQTLETHLKAILQGTVSQIGGLYELANRASDRHARRYNPAAHHAKLAVNVAFTLCEFVLSSYEYQQQRQVKKATA